MLIIGFLSGSFLGQQMQFVELAPQWECSKDPTFTTGEIVKCFSNANKISDADKNVVNFCTDKSWSHRRNESDSLSLHNWIEDLDLACST